MLAYYGNLIERNPGKDIPLKLDDELCNLDICLLIRKARVILDLISVSYKFSKHRERPKCNVQPFSYSWTAWVVHFS